MAEMNENNIEEMIDETVDTAVSDTTTEAAADAVEAIGDKIEYSVEEAAEEKKDVAPVSSNIKQGGDNEPHWYVVHTYSGYENKVKPISRRPSRTVVCRSRCLRLWYPFRMLWK